MRLYNKPTSDGNSFCGGTLIASKYVISAAHCMFEYDNSGLATAATTADLIAIRIGDHNLDLDGETSLTPKFVNVVKITNHPDYNQNIVDGYDISILQLEEELALDVYTPACLEKNMDDSLFSGPGNWTGTVAGWGYLEEARWLWPWPTPPNKTSVPHEVDLPIMPAADCKWSHRCWPFWPFCTSVPSIICAAYPEGGKDTCQVQHIVILLLRMGHQSIQKYKLPSFLYLVHDL